MSADPALPAPIGELPVVRSAPSGRRAALDQVAAEVPVALSLNGISHAVMMATPADIEDFALGFALSEGLIGSPAECYGIEVRAVDAGIDVQLQLASRAFEALKQRRRAFEGRTGCGVCGVESLAALDLRPEPLPPGRALPALGPAEVSRAFHELAGRQPLNAQSGACHAAGWAAADGHLLEVAEDVGRHNALDKLIGRLARTGRLAEPGFAIVSSRASYELVRKCARLQLPALAAISAPTTLAVDIARRAGLRLFGFCRADSTVEYTASG